MCKIIEFYHTNGQKILLAGLPDFDDDSKQAFDLERKIGALIDEINYLDKPKEVYFLAGDYSE